MDSVLQWLVSCAALIAAFLALRAVTRGRISAKLQYALWLIVLIRLLIPGSVARSPISVLNAVPDGEVFLTEADMTAPTVSADPRAAAEYAPAAGAPAVSPPVSAADAVAPYVEKAVSARPDGMDAHRVAVFVWLIGAVCVCAWFLISNLRLYRLLMRTRQPLSTDCPVPVYTVAGLWSPCLFGVVRPCVYLSPETAREPDALRCVLAHELAHYKNRDNLWGLMRGLAIAIHWFDPLVWYAARVSLRDGELAADERAISALGEDSRFFYGRTLIDLVAVRSQREDPLCCATLMGGGGMEERIKMIAARTKKTLCAAIAAVLTAAIAAGCTFTGATIAPASPTPEAQTDGYGVVQTGISPSWDVSRFPDGERVCAMMGNMLVSALPDGSDAWCLRDFTGEKTPNCFACAPDGSVWYCTDISYSAYPSGGGESRLISSTLLSNCVPGTDADVNYDISSYLPLKSGSDAKTYVCGMIVDADGVIFLLTSEPCSVIAIDPATVKPLFTLSDIHSCADMALTADGQPAVLDCVSETDGTHSDSRLRLIESGGKWSADIELTPSGSYTILSGAEYDLYLADSAFLYGLDLADNALTDILPRGSYDIMDLPAGGALGGDRFLVRTRPDGDVALLVGSAVGGTGFSIRYVAEGEVPSYDRWMSGANFPTDGIGSGAIQTLSYPKARAIINIDISRGKKHYMAFTPDWLPEVSEPDKVALGSLAPFAEQYGVSEQEADKWCYDIYYGGKDTYYRVTLMQGGGMRADHILNGDTTVEKETVINGLNAVCLTADYSETAYVESWDIQRHIVLYDTNAGYGIHIVGTADFDTLTKIAENLRIFTSDATYVDSGNAGAGSFGGIFEGGVG